MSANAPLIIPGIKEKAGQGLWGSVQRLCLPPQNAGGSFARRKRCDPNTLNSAHAVAFAQGGRGGMPSQPAPASHSQIPLSKRKQMLMANT